MCVLYSSAARDEDIYIVVDIVVAVEYKNYLVSTVHGLLASIMDAAAGQRKKERENLFHS